MIELVVIGGSAGALEALLAFVPALPVEFVVPIVIVMHLGCTQKNLVPEILRNVIQNELNQIITTGYVLGGLIGVCTFGLQKLLGL